MNDPPDSGDRPATVAAAFAAGLAAMGALVAFISAAWWQLVACLVLLAGVLVVARLVAARRPPRDFVADCCHRIDGVLRAGPPSAR